MDQKKESKQKSSPQSRIQNVNLGANALAFAMAIQNWKIDQYITIFLNTDKNYSLLLSHPEAFPASSASDRDMAWKLSVPLTSFPIDISDFRVICEEKYRFIDKSLLIEKIWDEKRSYKVITGPRGFGKTFNLSMLYCYFSNLFKDRAILFHKLNIWQNKKFCRQHHGKYPVIFLTFKDIQSENYEEAIKEFGKLIIKTFEEQIKQHEFECKGDLALIKAHPSNEAILQSSLERLISHLYNYYRKKVILLLDEYDTPLYFAYAHTPIDERKNKDSYYQKMVIFIEKVFGSTLKENHCLQAAILTGILPMATDRLFFDIDNIEICSTLDDGLREYFWFSPEEVFEQFQDAIPNITEEQLHVIMDHCDAHVFGEKYFFNPYLIVKYFEHCRQNGVEHLMDFIESEMDVTRLDFPEELSKQSDEKVRREFEQPINSRAMISKKEEKPIFKNLDKLRIVRDSDEIIFFKEYLNAESFKRNKLHGIYTFIMQGNADISSIEIFIQNLGNDDPWWDITCQIFQTAEVINKLDNRFSTKRIARSLIDHITILNEKNGNTAVRILNNMKRSDDVVEAVIEKLRIMHQLEAIKCIEKLSTAGVSYQIVTNIFTSSLVDAELSIEKIEIIIECLSKWLISDSHVALNTLLQGLISPNIFIQLSCMVSLGLSWHGSDIVVKKIKYYLTKDEFIIRMIAIGVLGQLSKYHNSAALEIMEEFLSSANEIESLILLVNLKGDESFVGSWKGSKAAVLAFERCLDSGIWGSEDLVHAIKQIGKWAVNGNSDAFQLLRQAMDSKEDEKLQSLWISALKEADVFYGSQEVIEFLAEKLEIEESPERRHEIIEILNTWANHGAKTALDALIRCLKTSRYEDVCERCIVALEIGKKNPEIVQILAKCFDDLGSKVHIASISRLAYWAGLGKDQHALHFLMLGLHVENPIHVRIKCAVVLKEVSTIDTKVGEELSKCLKDRDPNLCIAALDTLITWAAKDNKMAIDILIDALNLTEYPEICAGCARGLKGTGAYSAIDRLGELMQSGNVDIRSAAIFTLSDWAGKDNKIAQNVLMKGLSSDLQNVRQQCVLALGKTKNFTCIREILEFLKDEKSKDVQAAARITLSEWAVCGNEEAMQALLKGLEGLDTQELWFVALQNLKMGNDVIAKLLEKYLNDLKLTTRNTVIKLFKKWIDKNNPCVIEILIAGLNSKYPDVRKQCIDMLSKVKDELKLFIAKSLVIFLKEEKESEAQNLRIKNIVISIFVYWAVYWSWYGGDIVFDALEHGLNSSSQKIRESWLHMLLAYNVIHNSRVAKLVVQYLLKHTNSLLQETVIKTLTKWIEKSDISLPSSLLSKGLDSNQQKIREFFINILRKNSYDEKVVNALIPCLKDHSSTVRAAAITALISWGENEVALSALIEGLKVKPDRKNSQAHYYSLWDKAVMSLESCLTDNAECVRAAAIHALSVCANTGKSKIVTFILQKGLLSEFDDVKMGCLLAFQSFLRDTKNMMQSLQDCIVSAKTVEVRVAAMGNISIRAAAGNSIAFKLVEQGLSSQEKELRREWILSLKIIEFAASNIVRLLGLHLNDPKLDFCIEIADVLMQWTIKGNKFSSALLSKVLCIQPEHIRKRYIIALQKETEYSESRVKRLVKSVENMVRFEDLALELPEYKRNLSIQEDDIMGENKKGSEVGVVTAQQIRAAQKKDGEEIGQQGRPAAALPKARPQGGIHSLSDSSSASSSGQSSSSSSSVPQAQPAVASQDEGAVVEGREGRWMEIGEDGEAYAISVGGAPAIVRHDDIRSGASAIAIASEDKARLQYLIVKDRAKARAIAGERALEILDKVEKYKQARNSDFEAVKKSLDIDEKSKEERAEIHKSKELTEYYETLRTIHGHFGAAKSIQTGLIDPSQNMANLAIRAGAAIGKEIPFVGLGVKILEQILSAKVEIDKQKAMERLGNWVPSYEAVDRLSERFARRMTLLKRDEILKPPRKEELGKKFQDAHGIVEKARAAFNAMIEGAKRIKDGAALKAREIKKAVVYSEQEQLALADMVLVLDAIMDEKGIQPTKGVSDEAQLDSHLAKMLEVFPQSQALLSAAAAPVPQPLPPSFQDAPRYGSIFHPPGVAAPPVPDPAVPVVSPNAAPNQGGQPMMLPTELPPEAPQTCAIS